MKHSRVFTVFTSLVYLISLGNSLQLCKTSDDCTMGGCQCPPIEMKSPKSCFAPSAAQDMGKSCGCELQPGSKPNKSCVQCTIDQLYNPCSSKRAVACDNDSDCATIQGCSCTTASSNPVFPGSFCMNKMMYNTKIATCKTCTSNNDCPGSSCLSTTGTRKICADCEAKHAIDAAQKCVAKMDSETTTAEPTPVSVANNDISTDNESNESAPAQDESSTTSSNRESGNATTTEPTSAPVPCVSTEWLHENSILHAAIHHGGYAPVLCIPGLPCGTPGHLLRTSEGELISYLEVCKTRDICVNSVMLVSQLSHSFDWSQYQSEDASLSLTSLSAHPDAGAYHPSRLVAMLADFINNAGLGWVCNVVAMFPHNVRMLPIESIMGNAYWSTRID